MRAASAAAALLLQQHLVHRALNEHDGIVSLEETRPTSSAANMENDSSQPAWKWKD